MSPKTKCALGLAAAMACLGWAALATELWISLAAAFAEGRSIAMALYRYFRFFTMLSNIGLATLMSATVVAILRRWPWPAGPLYSAALGYMLVTSVTYEALLRHLWSPRGAQFASDMTLHDILPGLTLVFWLVFAPRDGARWRDPLLALAYPALYFAATLAAGALGAGYPYNFFDAGKLGYGPVLVIAVFFLVAFLVIGLVTTAVARWRAGA